MEFDGTEFNPEHFKREGCRTLRKKALHGINYNQGYVKENKMAEQSWEFYIAGVQHHEAKTVINNLKVGDLLYMIPEPTNKFDPNAIRLIHSTPEEGNTMLGFVKGKLSADIAAFMEVEDNVKCEIIELTPSAKPWEQIKVKISV